MTINRRTFLQASTAAITSAGLAPLARGIAEPFDRHGDSRLKLGLAAYSFRNYFPALRGVPNPKVPAEKRMKMTDFIRYCADQNCAAELTSYFFDPEVSDAHLADCRHLAHVSGVDIAGTAIGNNFSYPNNSPERAEQMAYTKKWIDRAAIMGAPHVRVFAGAHPKGITAEEAERNASEALEEAGAYAGGKGIFLGIENHDSISTAARLLRIVKAVDSKWVGVNLDTGNFVVDDPYPDIEACAPYAVNVQVKVAFRHGGKRDADLERIGKILKDTGYHGYVVLEYEENDDPYARVPPFLDRLRKFCDG